VFLQAAERENKQQEKRKKKNPDRQLTTATTECKRSRTDDDLSLLARRAKSVSREKEEIGGLGLSAQERVDNACNRSTYSRAQRHVIIQ